MNEWLAVRITNGVGTMWCAYVFCALALFGFPYGNIHPVPVVQWVSQEFLQLVLLSVIMVGQNVHSQQIDDVHATVKEVHHAIRD